jgi:hypothetical protein
LLVSASAYAQTAADQQQQPQTALDRYLACTGPILDKWMRAENMLAVMYPRFGIAWNEFKFASQAVNDREVRGELASDAANAQIQALRQKFIDRILSTAEPEALQWHQLYELKKNQAIQACGPSPF